MSRPKQHSDTPPPPRPEGLLDLPRFRVKGLRFKAGQPQDIPGLISSSSITDKAYKIGGRHTVEYVPMARHFLVTYKAADVTAYTMIHESVPLNVLLCEPVKAT